MKVFSTRGQATAVLLHALSTYRSHETKGYTCACIRNWGLLAYSEEDFLPYPSNAANFVDEPRWITLMAFARSDAVELGWMKRRDVNQWQISAAGRSVIQKLIERCSSGAVDVRNGYFWSPKFKLVLNPAYASSDKDAKRPWGSIYDDTKLSAFIDTLE